MGGSGGGGSSSTTTTIYQPTPPPQPSTADAVKEWVKSLPQVYETQLKYAPLEAAQQVELAQQYSLPLAEAAQEAQAALYPETQALQEQLAETAQKGMEEGISPEQRDQYEDIIKANIGTNIGSPIGAQATAKGLIQVEEDWKRYYRDLALSVSGRQPLAQPTQPQTSNYMQDFSPSSALDFQARNYQTYAQASRPIPLTNSQSSYSGGSPGFAGAAGAFAGGFFSSIRFKRNVKLWVKR